MPSESETLGFVVLEAMASALPVVAVAAGGLLDIITQPGITGTAPPSSQTPPLAPTTAGTSTPPSPLRSPTTTPLAPPSSPIPRHHRSR